MAFYKKRIVDLKEQMNNTRIVTTRIEIFREGESAAEYWEASDAVMGSLKRNLHWNCFVKHIFKVNNCALQLKYYETI